MTDMHAARSCAISAFAVLAFAVSDPLGAADATSAITAASATAAAAVDPIATSPWASARGTDQHGAWADLTVKGVVQRFRLFVPGTFMMWTPQHAVTLTPYWMADSACTQGLWLEVMESNPSFSKGNPGLRVEQVSWDDCQKMLSALNRLDGRLAARLPTEAEWEYACRTQGLTSQSPKMAPNALGLYDVAAYLSEWCGDWYGDDLTGAVTDPVGPASGSKRVIRGWDWIYSPFHLTIYRSCSEPGSRNDGLGFRICLPIQAGFRP